MIEYHLKFIVPLDGLFPWEDAAQDVPSDVMVGYIIGSPTRSELFSDETTKQYIKIMKLVNLANVHDMLHNFNSQTPDSVVTARNANGLQRFIKIVDADTSTTLLDWIQMPNDNGTALNDWITANIPTA